MVGHNRKECCRGSATKELIRGNGLERLVVAATESQPSRHSYHIAYAYQVIELGKHKEEGSKGGNQKFQLLEQAIKFPQMFYQNW